MQTTPETRNEALSLLSKTGDIFPNNAEIMTETPILYEKCRLCPDYGKSCNGPKLSAFQDIMAVREFHRHIRDVRKIPMRSIYSCTHDYISDATVNDYFSHAEKDFRWTTVALIDNALTQVCGNRIGEPPLDNPCPATSSEISAMISAEVERRKSFEDRCLFLEQEIERIKQKNKEKIAQAEEKSASSVEYLKNQILNLEAEKRDYLSRIDAKAKALEETEEEYRNATKWRTIAIIVMSVILAIALVWLSAYISWDFAHAGDGFILN